MGGDGHTCVVSLFDRFRRRGTRMSRPTGESYTGSTRVRAADATDIKHLEQFVETRRGVEGFVEPRTVVSEVTLLLVAFDGEWARRRVPSAQWAHKFADKRGIPSYDAARVGVPQRMRDYIRRQKEQGS
ncbi:hypothetical protein GCM10010197_32060 [Nocardioides luteus]|uniref:Oxidoreductase n=1 Tax=Nocardioides luteus TaxID=1844 RepID=A0ABQ5SS91_9ACTN|nr:hypothetical protein GCM10010197_32060 [Nocardioides luteus]GLJ66664.1 hypothetical protein GCM10017579_07000 [Nocardioides luteus]